MSDFDLAIHNGQVVSPGGVGFDINCGVRLVTTTLTEGEVRPKLRELINQVFRDVPCGTGGSGRMDITEKQLDEILLRGVRWMVENGYGFDRDIEFAEERGCLKEAQPDQVSKRARETYALSALDTAYSLWIKGDVPAMLAQGREAISLSRSPRVIQKMGRVLLEFGKHRIKRFIRREGRA